MTKAEREEAGEPAGDPGTPEDQRITAMRAQAGRYLEARYGQDVWYRAPETFGNTLERWIWAVASDAPSLAEESIAAIERHFKRRTDR